MDDVATLASHALFRTLSTKSFLSSSISTQICYKSQTAYGRQTYRRFFLIYFHNISNWSSSFLWPAAVAGNKWEKVSFMAEHKAIVCNRALPRPILCERIKHCRRYTDRHYVCAKLEKSDLVQRFNMAGWWVQSSESVIYNKIVRHLRLLSLWLSHCIAIGIVFFARRPHACACSPCCNCFRYNNLELRKMDLIIIK